MWKIVIIDDDRQVLKGMKQAIPWEELNAEWVGEALDGQAGLDLIRELRPDIVITDIYMPIMNGIDMIEQLRNDEFNGKIIILSGYSDFENARQALRLNVSDYLSKPISMISLRGILEKTTAALKEEKELRNKQDELEHKLKLYIPFVEKEWMKSIITGTYKEAIQLQDELPLPYQYWEGMNHTVIAVDIIRDDRIREASLSDLSLFQFGLENISREIVQDYFTLFDYTNLHGAHSAFVLHTEKSSRQEEVNEQILNFSTKIIENIQKYLKLNLKIGIGETKEHWEYISDSTEEAFRAIEWKTKPIPNGYEIYSVQENSELGKRLQQVRPVKFYQELASAVKSGQAALSERIIDEFIQALNEEEAIDVQYFQFLARETWSILVYSMYEVGMMLDEYYPQDTLVAEWNSLNSAEQLESWLKEKIQGICNSRQWKSNGKHRQAVDFMIQYIHDHFEQDITLADLAEKVYISRNYLSHIFKNMTGDSFNTYLTKVRMEKAKELLLEHKLLVYEVAEKVGYQNVPYFSTLFKKYTGMNPTDLVKA